MHRPCIDNSAPPPLQHPWQGSLGGVKGRVQADVHDCIPLVLWKVLYWRNELDAHVVDKNIKLAKSVLHPADHLSAAESSTVCHASKDL